MRRPVPAVALLVVALLGACGEQRVRLFLPVPAPPSPASTAAPSMPVGPPGRLSGIPTRAGAPVLAVKVDATAGGRPQAGVGAADVVYVEQVEGGLTRLLAVFNSRLPTRVGPVRSVRTDNVELLAQYGRVAFAYSGGQPAALSVVRASPLVDLGFDGYSGQYAVDPGRPAPYNLFINPEALLSVRTSDGARDTGLRFEVARAPRAGAGTAVSLAYPSARYDFSYDPAVRAYRISADGTPLLDDAGSPVRAANVVIQRVAQVLTDLQDVNGSYTPAHSTIGAGAVTVFRDGHSVEGTWSRAAAEAPTRFRAEGGVDIALRPGSTWVLLAPAAAPLAAR